MNRALGPRARQSDPASPGGTAYRRRLRRALLSHFDRSARDLPWRGESDPYRILVSEVMLQQTRVETVKRYYGPWLERFPDVESVAAADEDEVLKAWEGLGYYRRARNLRRAALVVRETSNGLLPRSYGALRELPGVGEYTAGAVASIAFGARVPAVDGNVRRVLARLLDEPDPRPGWLREHAAELVDEDRPGDWNQALMELGATVCLPKAPKCDVCPVTDFCRARAAGVQEERPAPTAKRPARKATIVLGVLHRLGRVLLVRRPAEGLLGGMWALPERDVGTGRASESTVEASGLAIVAELGLKALAGPEPLPAHEHRFTHVHALYLPVAVEVEGDVVVRGRDAPDQMTAWVEATQPGPHALPVAQRRVLESWSEQISVEAG